MAPATAPSMRSPRKRGRFSNRCPEATATSVTARPAPRTGRAVDFDAAGRLGVRVLQELGVPREADFYLCGPAAFMSGLTADLIGWGVSAERLHSENFGSGPALTPGVAAASAAAAASARPARRRGADGVFRQKQSGRCAGIRRFRACSNWPRPAMCRCDGRVAPASATIARPGLIAGAVDYLPDPLEPPGDGNLLICCSRPRADIVLDL